MAKGNWSKKFQEIQKEEAAPEPQSAPQKEEAAPEPQSVVETKESQKASGIESHPKFDKFKKGAK